MQKNVLVFMVLLTACQSKQFNNHLADKLDVSYCGDSIIVNGEEPLKLIAKEGQYVTCDGKLFLSNSKDTTFIVQNYMCTIKHDSDRNVNMTLCYRIVSNDSAILLSQFVYDNDYRIKGLRIGTMVEYY